MSFPLPMLLPFLLQFDLQAAGTALRRAQFGGEFLLLLTQGSDDAFVLADLLREALTLSGEFLGPTFFLGQILLAGSELGRLVGQGATGLFELLFPLSEQCLALGQLALDFAQFPGPTLLGAVELGEVPPGLIPLLAQLREALLTFLEAPLELGEFPRRPFELIAEFSSFGGGGFGSPQRFGVSLVQFDEVGL